MDARADLFAFGAILHEMAAGERAFAADSQAGLIAALLDQHPPPISAIVPSAPRSLERVVQRCLEEDRDDRWQSAQDLASELKWIDQSLRQPESRAIPAAASAAQWRRLFIAGGILLAAAVFLTVPRRSLRAGASLPRPPRRRFIRGCGCQRASPSRDGDLRLSRCRRTAGSLPSSE